MYPADFRYSKDHEWVKSRRRHWHRSGSPTTRKANSVTLSSSNLPKVGTQLKAGQTPRHDRIRESGERSLQPGFRRSDGRE